MPNLTTQRQILILLCIVVIGCNTRRSKKDSFGLTLIEMDLSSEEQSRLNSTVFSKIDVPAKIYIDGQMHRIKTSYSGKSTIDDNKKSWNLKFYEKKAYKKRSKFRLSAQTADPSMLRSLIGFKVYGKAGVHSSKVYPVTFYLNGEHMGLYMLIEPVGKEYFKRRDEKVTKLYKAQFGRATFSTKMLGHIKEAIDIKEGPNTYSEFDRIVGVLNEPVSESNLKKLESTINIENYLRYIAASFYLGNWDAHRNNFYMYKKEGSDLYHFAPWDLDKVYDEAEDVFPYEPGKTIFEGNELTTRLMRYPKIKEMYIDILWNLIEEEVKPKKLKEWLEEYKVKIAASYEKDRFLAAGTKGLKTQAKSLEARIDEWLEELTKEVRSLKEQQL